jgi:hypothetical protein
MIRYLAPLMYLYVVDYRSVQRLSNIIQLTSGPDEFIPHSGKAL